MSVWVTCGHLVTWNQIWGAQLTQPPKNLIKRHITCIDAEYSQGYGSPFLLNRCQGPEHPKISQKKNIFKPKFWPGNVKMASRQCQTCQNGFKAMSNSKSQGAQILRSLCFCMYGPIWTSSAQPICARNLHQFCFINFLVFVLFIWFIFLFFILS